MDKFDSDTALAKIKVLFNKYYEDIGRGYGELNDLEVALIYGVDEVLDNVDIDTKKVIIERLELDGLNKP